MVVDLFVRGQGGGGGGGTDTRQGDPPTGEGVSDLIDIIRTHMAESTNERTGGSHARTHAPTIHTHTSL